MLYRLSYGGVNNFLFAIFTRDGNTLRTDKLLPPDVSVPPLVSRSKIHEGHLSTGGRPLERPPRSLRYDGDRREPWVARLSCLAWVSRLAWCCSLV